MNNQVVDGIRYNLRSTLFNFDLAHPIVSECFTKLSYDYSYNIYFTDGKNQIRVVNGSIIVSDGQATFNNRVYTPADFSTEINLTLNTLKYTKTELLSVTDGGQLKYGNYIYYIKYKTQDENLTNVIAQSSIVSVFQTTTTGSNGEVVYGGSSQIGENTSLGQNFTDVVTNKKVVLNITDLDTSYNDFRIVVEYSTGDDISASTFYELNVDFPITTSTLQIEHTGFEDTLTVANTTINQLYYSAFVAKSITQLDGRLFATNIKLVNQDFITLDKFAKCFYLSTSDFTVGTLTNVGDTTVFPIDGYRNPLFIYSSLGYWSGETYAFGLSFKLGDGSETQSFLPVGYDYTKVGIDLTNSRNTDGIIRLPNQDGTFNAGTMKGRNVVLNFDITAWNTLTVEERGYIESNILGYKVLRAERNKDCITQGVVSQTYSIPTFEYTTFGGSWLSNSDGASWRDNIFNKLNSPQWTSYQNANDRRVIPAMDGICETEAIFKVLQRGVCASQDTYQIFSTNNKFINQLVDERRYAFYSADCDLDRSITTRFNDVSYGIKGIGRYSTVGYNKEMLKTLDYDTLCGFLIDIHGNTTFLIKASNYQPVSQDYTDCKSFIVDGGRDITNGLFSSRINYLHSDSGNIVDTNGAIAWGQTLNIDTVFREHTFEPYIGLVRTDALYSPLSFGLEYTGQDSNQGSPNIMVVPPVNGTAPTLTVVNIYNDRQRDNYLTLYPQVTNLQYKPVTQGTFIDFNNIQNTTETIYRGDCYVGEYFKRLWYCPNSEVGYTGTMLQIVTENNVNPYLRHYELLDINEGQRGFYPAGTVYLNTPVDTNYNSASSTWGLATGVVNGQLLLETRYRKTLDSRAYNKGYTHILGEQRFTAFDVDLPTQATHFPTRVLYSEQQVALSFTDYYRQVGLANTQDYSFELGEAVDITSIGYNLYLTQQRGITKLPYKERIPISNGGQVFISGTGVLTQYGNLLAHIGSQHTHSIVTTDNSIYGIDVNRRKLWGINGDTVQAISEDVVGSYIKDRLAIFNYKSDIEGTLQVRTFWDKTKNEVMFNFYITPHQITDSEELGLSTFNLCWNEKLQIFQTFYSYSPNQVWYLNGDTLSFPSNSLISPYSKDIEINGYKHNTGEINTFYGAKNPTIIEMVVNENTAYSKVFDNHSIIGNNIYPDEIQWNTENQKATRTKEWLLSRRRLRQEENRVQVVIGSSDTDKQEEYNHSRLNSRIRDKYTKVRFKYNTDKKLRIQTILTKYRISNV
jgi:hypothetical protein